MNMQTTISTSGWVEATPLHLPLGLWLLPAASLRLRVALPTSGSGSNTSHGVSVSVSVSVSGWEATEKVRELARPDTLSSLKLVSSGPSRLRFHAELDDRRRLRTLIKKLNGATIQLSGFKEPLKLEAFEPDSEFPVRHTWDSFFRDAANMDEMKPGERPDTLHIANLPVQWFKERMSTDEDPKPSESLFRKVFERYGKVRYVDVPVCDPYRKQMKEHMTGMSKFSFDSELYFEGYIQFSEYVAFVRAMDAMRDMKLAKKNEDGSGQAVTIRVDFDRSKHLTDASIKRRSIVRERLTAREKTRQLKEEDEITKKKKKEEAESLFSEFFSCVYSNTKIDSILFKILIACSPNKKKIKAKVDKSGK
ncbi:A-kinase anchor protein 17A isoform X2 [Arctopsyche grandis]|uniref:A-kinase anchor protein 17A isoform X2 n=1 Tax=Arctopsyche grandis TaxID=121162 RepID=UPI00406D8963